MFRSYLNMWRVLIYGMSSTIPFITNMNAQLVGEADCLPRVTSNIPCVSANSVVGNPNDCRQYFRCLTEKKRECGTPYLGYTEVICENDMFFDPTFGECMESLGCPTDPMKPCLEHGETYGVSGSCRRFKFCDASGNTGAWENRECRPREYFDEISKSCKPGRCPGCNGRALDYAKCDTYGQGHKFGNPFDCTKYFTCEPNLDNCGSGPWGYMEHDCPVSQYYDVRSKNCIAVTECPQACPPKIDKDYCMVVGDNMRGASDDCRGGGPCVVVETCPDNAYAGYLALDETIRCTDGHEFYNAESGKCIQASACPREPEENCKLIWEPMAERCLAIEGVEKGLSWCRSMKNGTYHYGRFRQYLKSPDSYQNANWKCAIHGIGPVEHYEVLSEKNTNLKLSPLMASLRNSEYQRRQDTATFDGKRRYFAVSYTQACYRNIDMVVQNFIDNQHGSIWHELICK